ncbi:AAA family ATPase [Nocardioides caricicola]|uniref:AAA family ATPase n=2 Tax=Nocardioides caricicola TaxID=634770 RepID=A0ABW0MVD8_9ACTN
MFPTLPTTVANLLAVTQSETVARMTVDFRDIACFNGAPGTGKTTAVTLATQKVGGVTWKYCIPPQRASTKGAMLALYESVFGWCGPLSEREATDALARRLSEGDLGVVIDEVHHVGLLGMQQYRHLWDRTCIYDERFPMIFVGCNVRETLARADEVRTRIARWVLFDHIQHPDDLVTLAHELHPRLAVTSESVLERINENITDGNIRAWYQFAKHIDYLPTTTGKGKPKPIKGEDIRRLQNLLGAR